MFGNHIASEGFIFRMYNMNYQNSKEKKNKQKMDISTHMQSTSCEMPGWVKHKLESRLPGERSITSDDITLLAESKEELKSLLIEGEREE